MHNNSFDIESALGEIQRDGIDKSLKILQHLCGQRDRLAAKN